MRKVINSECLSAMKKMKDNSVDTIISDPPYGLSFMGAKWDYDVPSVEIWQECLRVLKPGGTALIFAGSRTQHRMACNIEDAGFILKDCIIWMYGSGFPKSTNISKNIDKKKGKKGKVIGNGATNCEYLKRGEKCLGHGDKGKRQSGETIHTPITAPATPESELWSGWHSHGLKPSYEPVLVCMKPNEGSYADNALKWGVAGLNIDGSRIGTDEEIGRKQNSKTNHHFACSNYKDGLHDNSNGKGRYPANIILECTCDNIIKGGKTKAQDPNRFKKVGFEVFGEKRKGGREEVSVYADTIIHHTDPNCPCKLLDEQSGMSKSTGGAYKGNWKDGFKNVTGNSKEGNPGLGDTGGASRFFYCAKVSKKERNIGCEELEEKKYGTNFVGSPKSGSVEKLMKKGLTKEEVVKEINDNLSNKNSHPCVKPIALMSYLCNLTRTPTGGIVLDPFAGSCSTALACIKTNRDFIMIEMNPEYCKIGKARIKGFIEENKTLWDTLKGTGE